MNEMKNLKFQLFKTAILFIVLFSNCTGGAKRKYSYGDQVGINYLNPDIVSDLDSITNRYRKKMHYARVGIVYNGTVVFTKAYVRKNINEPGEWASISKPATALIVMKLVEEGYIKSINKYNGN